MFTSFGIKKEIFDFLERHNTGLDLGNKNSFFIIILYICMFVMAIISFVVMSIAIYIICRHTKLKSVATSLALQQIREVGMVAKQEHVSITHDVQCTCKIQWYTIFMLSLAVLGIIIFIVLNARKNAVYIRCSVLCTSKIV